MQLVIISLIWSEADSPLVNVTPRILRAVTRTMLGIARGGVACRFYRAMHFSAKRGIAIACRLSVCPSVYLSVCDVGEL